MKRHFETGISHHPEPMRERSPVYPGGYDPCGPVTEAAKPRPDLLRVAAYTARVAAQLKAAKDVQANPLGVREDAWDGIDKPKEVRRGTGNLYPTGIAPIEWIEN
jgi:hypothetical protein